MLRLFGHIPYPQPKEPLEFQRKDFPVKQYSCEEFNALAFYIHNLNRYY